MKKFLFIIACVFLLTGCGKSEEEKLNEIVANATKSTLYIPESYDPVSLECDTLAIDIISEANIKKAAHFVDLMKEAKYMQHDIDYNNEQKEYWRGQYGKFFNEYSRKAQKAEIDQIQKKAEARAILIDLYNQYNSQKEFIGFLADHKFRAKNNAGQVNFGEYLFILNKDKSEILATFDGQDEKTLYFFQLMEGIRGLGEDCDFENVDLFSIADNIKSKFDLMH